MPAPRPTPERRESEVAASDAPLPSAAELEQSLLGERRKYTRSDVAALAAVHPDLARRMWRAMGFPNVADDVAAFTDGDVDAMRRVAQLIDDGLIDEQLAASIVRALGRNMSRLSEWLGEAFTEHLARSRSLDPDDAARHAVQEAGALLPEIEALVVYAWRRQLAAMATRTMRASDEELTSGRLAVGFADLVGFTRLSRRLEEHELAEVVETFEARASDIVAMLGGRVVKTVGDEVLFVADSAEVAAEIGLQLAETMAAHAVVPDVRVGVAVGTVLTRLGDVFGTTVNRASRLTPLAAPGTVVVDDDMAASLRGSDLYTVTPQWRRRLRGIGAVSPSLLGRAHGGGTRGTRSGAREVRPHGR